MSGVIFDRSSASRIAKVVKAAEGTATNSIFGTGTNLGRVKSVEGWNDSGVSLPAGAVVWLRDLYKGRTRVTLPEYAGILNVGICAGPIAPNGYGSVFVSGDRIPILAEPWLWSIYSVGKCLVPQIYSYVARMLDQHDVGPFMVVGVDTNQSYLLVNMLRNYVDA